MRSLVRLMLLVGVVVTSSAHERNADIIKPASTLPETTPWDLQALSAAPAFEWADATNQIRSLFFRSERFRDKRTRVFAYYATPGTLAGDPALDKNLPAMVLVHGGGGHAFDPWVRLWAKRGYAAISMDLAGVGPNKQPLADGGPGQGHDMKFDTIGEQETDQWTYHAVANVIRAHSLIRSFTEVDPKKTGITGISWGGYLTCIVAGLDHRFQVAVPVYGCGFLHENSAWLNDFAKMSEEHREKWVRLWDPSQYIGSVHMPILFVNGGTDFAYPPDSHARTVAKVPGERTLSFRPHFPHGHIFDRPPSVQIFVDHHLKQGVALAKVTDVKRGDEVVTAKVESATTLVKADLHYTMEPMPGDPRKRKWEILPAEIQEGRISAPVPPPETTIWFLTVEDERKAIVSSELVFPESGDRSP